MSELFPEVGKSPVAGHGPKAEVYDGDPDVVAVRLGAPGQALEGGTQALETWSQLLGFDSLNAGDRRLRLRSVRLRLEDARIELGLVGSRIGPTVVRLHPRRVQDDALLRVAVSLAGPVPNETVQRILIYVQQRLASAPYKSLIKAVRRDPDARPVTLASAAPAESPTDSPTEQRFAHSLVHTVSGTEAWHVFHAELEQQRNFSHSLTGNILVVRHEDLECSFATPPLRDDRLSFYNYGTYHVSHQSDAGSDGASPSCWELTTDLQEMDVISGGTGRVEALLDRVAQLEEKPELVIVKTSCVPAVTGEDLTEVAARFEERTGVTTVYLDNLADEEADPFSVMVQRLHQTSESDEPGDYKRRVNLVGFPMEREMDRLVELLEQLGVRINARMVPEVRLDALSRLRQAELQVFFDSHLYRSTFRQIRSIADIRAHYTVPPYGPERSRRWLADIVRELGITADVDAVFNSAWEPFSAPWERLKTRAQNQCLGFVLNRRAAELLRDPPLTVGVPVLALLDEMGFGLDLLLHEDVEDAAELPGTQTHFSTAEELAAQLRESRATAFYSELYYDRRLSRSGKAQFSITDFELGLGGAVSTLRRLLQICELPFYRRHGDALGPPFAGVIKEPE